MDIEHLGGGHLDQWINKSVLLELSILYAVNKISRKRPVPQKGGALTQKFQASHFAYA
jgi:hypothetical protein